MNFGEEFPLSEPVSRSVECLVPVCVRAACVGYRRNTTGGTTYNSIIINIGCIFTYTCIRTDTHGGQ